jgi:hypothetical protein
VIWGGTEDGGDENYCTRKAASGVGLQSNCR